MDTSQPFETKERIRSAALRVVSELGLGRASLRAIVRDAGVNTAAVNYHFGSREGLIRELFRRAITSLVEERKQLLADARKRAGTQAIPLRDLLHAKYWPIFSMFKTADPWRAWRQLSIIVQVRLDPSAESRQILSEHVFESSAIFHPEFARSIGVSVEEARMLVRLTDAIAWDLVGLPELAAELQQANDAEAHLQSVYQTFVEFAAQGMAPRRIGA